MRLTIDSNILVYAADIDAGERHRTGVAVVAQAARADCIITLQALSEFFFVSTRKAKLDLAEADEFVKDWRSVFPIALASERALASAIQTVQRHKIAFWDAMLVATAEEAGCNLLVSEDLQDGRHIGGVTVVNPFGPEMPALLREALRLP